MRRLSEDAHLTLNSVQVQVFKIREGSPEGIRMIWRKGFVKEMSFKSGLQTLE